MSPEYRRPAPWLGALNNGSGKALREGRWGNAICVEAPVQTMLLRDRSITVLCALVSHLGVTPHYISTHETPGLDGCRKGEAE